MNKFKKYMSIALAVVMAMFIVPTCAFAQGGDSMELKFNSDGKFKIMVFADIQDIETVQETTLALMNEALDRYKPDLVVYLGDNTVASGYENQCRAIKTVTEPCVSRNVPYAIVFGNHDQEQGVTKEVLLSVYRQYGCLTYDAAPEIYGCGNCNLPILSSDGTKTAFNLWLMDSGSDNPDKSVGGYDYIREDQIQWYKDTAEKLKEQNGREAVPSINFQHIIIPEIFDILGYPVVPFGIPGTTVDCMGKKYLRAAPFRTHDGIVFETPCPPSVADGQFDAWKETGDVIASFFGHDHLNSFHVKYDGIDLTSVPSVGCYAYYNELLRGFGIITLDESDLSTYDYELVRSSDMAVLPSSSIPSVEGGLSRARYMFLKTVADFYDLLHKVVYNIFNR